MQCAQVHALLAGNAILQRSGSAVGGKGRHYGDVSAIGHQQSRGVSYIRRINNTDFSVRVGSSIAHRPSSEVQVRSHPKTCAYRGARKIRVARRRISGRSQKRGAVIAGGASLTLAIGVLTALFAVRISERRQC